jgi:hypothetical protein
MKKISYTKKPSFINRSEELRVLSDWISQQPEQILFIYGPKSSGKTTLLKKFIENNLTCNLYDIKHFNLRKTLITDYKNFIHTFFKIDYSKSNKEVKTKKEYNVKFFKLTTEILKGIENKEFDPFDVMFVQLEKIAKKGKQPVIIIDELQALEDIYLNGQRQLLKELFNFFVAITKEDHLCHVIIASSDGYFMNRIYNDSKLIKTSEFFEVEYLDENDTKYWLSNLEKESGIKTYTLSDFQINEIWKYFGGSMWEISNILGQLISYASHMKVKDAHLEQIIQRQISINSGRFYHYARLNKQKIALLKEIFSVQQYKTEFNESDLSALSDKNIYEENALTEELNNLVRSNYLAFNPTTCIYKVQGKSIFYGLKDYVEKI